MHKAIDVICFELVSPVEVHDAPATNVCHR